MRVKKRGIASNMRVDVRKEDSKKYKSRSKERGNGDSVKYESRSKERGIASNMRVK